MKKKILSAILSFAMLFSVVASVGSITASAAIADGLAWKMVFEELMTENPAGDGTGKVENFYTLKGYPGSTTWISGDPKPGRDNFANYGEAGGFTEQALRTNGADLKVTASPLYNNVDNTKVRIEFGFASKKGYNLKANVNLVGSVDGETVTTSTSTSNKRFIFISGQKVYYDNPTYRVEDFQFEVNTCYKFTIDIDCATDTYDVYVNGELRQAGIGLAYDFDAIYGVGFSASAESFYVDDIRYYTVDSTGTGVTSNVTLNANGGNINSGNVTSYTEGVGAKLPENVTKAGYEFGGWYDNANFTGDPVKVILSTDTGDKTYYAKWLNVYSVTLNTNGGSINSGDVTSYAESIGATLPTDITKADYKFLGWYEDASFSGSAVIKIPANATGNKTFYAKWEKLVLIKEGIEWEKIFEETMTEEPIDSGRGPIDQYYDLGAAYPSTSTWISGDPGRGFKNYSEKYGFTEQAIRLGGDAILNVEKSPLYSNPNNSFKIRIEFGFAINHQDAKAYIDLVGDVDRETVTTTHSNNERFVYVTGNQLFFGNGIEGEEIAENTCYKFTIDIDCEAGIYDVYVNDEPSAVGVELPYDFDAIYGVGFSRTSNALYIDDLRYYTIKTVGTGVFSNVTLNANGGSINSGAITNYEEGIGVALPLNVTKAGHKFAGWYDNAEFTGDPVRAITSKVTGDKTYYAKWLAIYSVTLNENGGTINSGNVTEYTESIAVKLPTAVTKAGVYFAGWYENADFSGSAVTTIPADATGNKTYYAKYAQWPIPGSAPIILLKFDDLNSASAADKFKLAFDIVKEKGVKCGMGVVCSNLEDDPTGVEQADIDKLAEAIKTFHSEGAEIWSHGYRHTAAEYGSDSYEQQKESFGKALSVMKRKCGIDITSFGSPENKSTSDTVRMINENYPQIKTLMLVKDHEHIAIPEVVTVRANIEISTGVFDFDNFKKQYERVKTAKAIVLQGHPDQWDNNERKQLEQTIDYLKADGAIFMTPTEYANYCEATDGKEQWEKVWHLDFETENDWKNYFETTAPDVMGDYNTEFTDTTNESQGEVAMNAGSTYGIQNLNLIAEKSPLYNEKNNGKVRIEFDFLKVNTTEDFWINLVGKVDGEVTQTTRNYAERFIFMDKDKIYFDNDTERWVGPSYLEKTWYKMTIDIDCENRLYDVYINDRLQCENNRLAFAFDEIYGVSFTADNSGAIEMNKPLIDNIRYYTEAGNEVYFMEDSTEKTVLVHSDAAHSDLTLYVAAYKEGIMTDVIVKPNVDLAEGINTLPVDCQWGWDDRDTVKVFLWGDKISPVAIAKTFVFNQ